MKTSVSLAMYGINVKSEDSKKFYTLNKIPKKNYNNSYFDLLDALKKSFGDLNDSDEFYKSKNIEEDNGNRIFLSEFYELDEFENRGIYGIVNFGNFGNEKEVHDITKKKNTENSRIITRNEGVFEPYYFLLMIPKNVNEGILILEQKRGVGIKGIFTSVFLDSLVNYTDYAHCNISLSRVFPEELKEHFYVKGNLKSIKLIKNKIPDDICDNLNTAVKNIETIIKIDDKKITPKEYFDKNRGNILSFESFDYDIIKAQSEYNGKRKTFILTNPDSLIPYLDITNEIEFSDNGNPKLKSIHKVAIEHLKINFKEIFDRYN